MRKWIDLLENADPVAFLASWGLGPKGGEFELDGAQVKLAPAPKGRVELEFIGVPEDQRGGGVASRALKEITARADQFGLPLELNVWCSAGDDENVYLDSLALEQWYERHGFDYAGDRDGFAIHVRKPAVAEEAMTISGATDSDGEISREKSERILDPQGFFKKAKAPYLKK